MTTHTYTITAFAPKTYITIKEAGDALGLKPWPVVELIDNGELRAVRYGSLTLVSAYDVQELGRRAPRCGRCGCAGDALIHHATANGHDYERAIA